MLEIEEVRKLTKVISDEIVSEGFSKNATTWPENIIIFLNKHDCLNEDIIKKLLERRN